MRKDNDPAVRKPEKKFSKSFPDPMSAAEIRKGASDARDALKKAVGKPLHGVRDRQPGE